MFPHKPWLISLANLAIDWGAPCNGPKDHCVVRCAWRSGGASRKVVAGGAGGRETRLQRPFAVALDVDGSLLVCDSGQHRILRFQRSGDTYAATGEVRC